MLDGSGCSRPTQQHIMGTLGNLAIRPPLRQMHLLRETAFLARKCQRPEVSQPAPGRCLGERQFPPGWWDRPASNHSGAGLSG